MKTLRNIILLGLVAAGGWLYLNGELCYDAYCGLYGEDGPSAPAKTDYDNVIDGCYDAYCLALVRRGDDAEPAPEELIPEDPEPIPEPEPEPDPEPEPEPEPVESAFQYYAAGKLITGSANGSQSTGVTDPTVNAPGMRYPLESGPSYLNSQVYRPGGMSNQFPGDGGSQCAASNYAYPWQDNFCEARSWDVSQCPSTSGHQGQDIRPAACPDANFDGERETDYWVVATEDGVIQSIGSYTVYLMADSGVRYRFMHLDHSTLQVAKYDRVNKGDRLGVLSNNMGVDGNGDPVPTTYHLHFDMKQSITTPSGNQFDYVSPYMSLVQGYETLIGEAGVEVE